MIGRPGVNKMVQMSPKLISEIISDSQNHHFIIILKHYSTFTTPVLIKFNKIKDFLSADDEGDL